MRDLRKASKEEKAAHKALKRIDFEMIACSQDHTHSAPLASRQSLNRALMRYDAAFHPEPGMFDEWAQGGGCPYLRRPDAKRAVPHFSPDKGLWSPGRAMSAVKLLAFVRRVRRMKSGFSSR